MAEEDVYAKDGTTDFRNRPAINKETGTWKACPYILGGDIVDIISINPRTKTILQWPGYLLVCIQTNVGWSWGFSIPAVAMAIAVMSFFSGMRLYRNQRPGGSSFTRICHDKMTRYKVQDSNLAPEVCKVEFMPSTHHSVESTFDVR